jgi:hypothetical protein
MEGSPHDFSQHWLKKLGQGAYDLLVERMNDLDFGRMYRRTKGKGDIAAHYRAEFERMKREREDGETEVDFDAFI